MTYLSVDWHHASPDDPVSLFYEWQDDHCVTRMVEAFSDGSLRRNSLELEARNPNVVNNLCLCDGSMTPESLEQDRTDPTFTISTITRERFDDLFDRAQNTDWTSP